MPRVDKTMLLAVLAGAAIAAVSASCANSCSGHGSCGSHDRCTCYSMWEGTDCSRKTCPSGPSATGDYEVCSGRGVCDSSSGACACSEGFTGYNCGRSSCPNDCSGHGKCAGVGATRQCVCDGYYTGADCSFRQCPRGDDPLTTEIECQGVASGSQSHEVQEITLTADKQLSGEMTLTYTDAYGQSWTTMPIAVGGDLEYDLRMSGGSTGCSLKYHSATLTSEKFRASGDTNKAGSATDFAATEFSVPGIAAAAMNSVDCDSLSAADMEALLEQNGVVKNVKVTKSGDANTDTARFHVSIGDLNFQNENDGMEVGVFSMTSRTDADFHSLGDRSQAIKEALQALPYNVVPSVDVSRVKVDGGSDYADSTVVYGNMVQQKYRVTFSDAANAGDQVSLQCNAEGCDADGCAPRYKGVTHKRYISTKYGSDPMDPTGGVTDYRTAIVATGQGSWWLRSHSLDVRTKSLFTSGTYYVHWDLGNGKTSSASFAYNADEAAIQTALRTIEGWGGVSVSCYGTPGFAGRDYTGTDVSDFGLECKVTYAKGFEDGGKLPTMTYHNIWQGMHAQVDGNSLPTHFTRLNGEANNGNDVGFTCKNEMCLITEIGHKTDGATSGADGDYTSYALFRAANRQYDYATASHFSANKPAKQDNWIGYVYIRNLAGKFPSEGVYEIVRSGSSAEVNRQGMSDLVIYAPGVPDMIKSEAITGDAFLYKATPLMPMWPSFSNSIALHDTSFRLIYSPNSGNSNPLHAADQLGHDVWGATAQDKFSANIHYGPFGTVAAAAGSTGLNMHPGMSCEGTDAASRVDGLLKILNDLSVSGPYPSLASTDGLSICDCKRTAMEVPPYEVEYTLTCPGWLGYLINNDAVEENAQDDTTGLKSEKLITDDDVAVVVGSGQINVFTHHRRLTPERTLEQLVAVGDTITVTASSANTNKQFKVKSFAYDNMWGDGSKGSAIWSDDYLGGDHSGGFGAGITLSDTVDYVSYGDFVPFLKVDPAPSDEYLVTEMYTEGTNGTHFTRTLEDISTTLAETATLTLYDVPSTEGSETTASNVKNDCSQLSGTFQLIYDGELSPVMPVTSSANQVMQYLSQMTTMTHVPVVSKTSAGTSVADTVEAVSPGADYVSWSFTFDPRHGDAKKLTFKFTDAVGDEQKTSAVIGSAGGSNYLQNTVGFVTHGGTSSRKVRYVNNKIVMTYSSGSTFYDSVDADYDGVLGGTTNVDDQSVDDKFHDELAMDVVPGTTMKVSSAEKHHVFLYQMESEGNQEANIDPVSGCVDNTAATAAETDEKTSKNLHIVVEYQGQFSKPHSLCKSGSADTWAAATGAGNLDAKIESDIAALKGLKIAIEAHSLGSGSAADGVSQNTGLDTTFNDHFSWGATHSGSARAVISFTLPMGADGDTFKVHLQLGAKSDNAVSRYTGTAKNHDFRVFTHRERNNNGRTFTVTKAYENKVSELLSVSRISYFAEKGGLAGVITYPNNAVAWDHSTACGADVLNKFNPGTYYNVKALSEDQADAANAASAGALLMVVVGGDGKINEVQVTAGGKGGYAAGKLFQFADTRMHASMLISDAAKRCEVNIGDNSEPKKSNMVMKSIASGIDDSMACLTAVTANTCTNGPSQSTAVCTGMTNPTFSECTGEDVGLCEDDGSTTCGDTLETLRKNCGAGCKFTTSGDVCVFTGTCGAKTFADTAYAGAFHHALNTADAGSTDNGRVTGARHTVECNDKHELAKITVTKGGESDTDATDANRADLNTAANHKLLVGSGATGYDLTTECTNDFYYQFGFYSTGTPRWNRDLSQNNHNMGKTPKDEQVSLYGMRNHMQYQFRKGTDSMATDTFYGKAREIFTDLNSGIGSFDVGYSITDTSDGNDNTPQMTASVIAGENGADAGNSGFGEMIEFAEKYAYIGKGYDKLTVTPIPDAMTDEKVTITYTGPSAGCSVTEVDRGTHESSECSGRGNCDYATGTCLCDAGYTLEACSEQTVLV